MEVANFNRMKQAAARFAAQVPTAVEADAAGLEALVVKGGAAAAPAREHKPAASERRRYLAETSSRERARATVFEAEARGTAKGTQRDTLLALARERIIGSSDLVDLNYLELAVAVSRAVARIRVGSAAGTGSLVGPGILMTNHHVIESKEAGRTAVAQFDYQENTSGELLPVQSFTLDPQLFFFTDANLDFTLIGVAPVSERGRKLADYPWLRLIENPGKVEKDDPVNIIQHPRGGLKQVALRNNLIIEIPGGKPAFLFYTTDTEPGSSGSPCFNDQWDVVALHHSGVPRMDGDHILRKDGKPFRENQDDPATIDWIANEGARISAIVAALKGAPLSQQEAERRAEMFEMKAPNPVELSRAGQTAVREDRTTGTAVRDTGGQPGTVSFSIPLNITVTLGGAAASQASVSASVSKTAPDAGAVVDGAEEAVRIDPNWSRREGYDPNFLGHKVALPALSAAMKANTVEVPAAYRKGGDRYTFHYHHYSLAMNRKRRFAWFSAANIDGGRVPKIPKRSDDKWFIDPRIDADVNNPTIQCGEELYATAKTDRGHLTRYLDVAWGATPDEAIRAVNDTFHFSNCCLELSGFNQGKDRWQGIEQYLLENKARKEKRRMAAMTGPLFKANDPIYRNKFMTYSVRIPLRFWKVCVLERADETLAATAFILDQEDITSLPGFEEKFDVGAAQITIRHLEELTGLDFGSLRQHDHFAAGGAAGALEVNSPEGRRPIRPIEDYADIVV
ncbi:MAG TPA: DNA/RNA non-specific endonuclease [Bryobacteraceae bacterium]|nr:DNA/RNA non-specific endonuclease [Bryobacteraceae bacterium]